MTPHIPPFVLGHCEWCNYRLSVAPSPSTSTAVAAPDCVHRGATLPGYEVSAAGLDVRKSYNLCEIGLGFPPGHVCSCFCGVHCKSYKPED